MIVLHVAEPQPLWLSLQHTPPFAGIAGSPVEVAGAPVEVADVPAEVADALAEVVAAFAEAVGILADVVDSIAVALAEVKEHIFITELNFMVWVCTPGILVVVFPLQVGIRGKYLIKN